MWQKEEKEEIMKMTVFLLAASIFLLVGSLNVKAQVTVNDASIKAWDSDGGEVTIPFIFDSNTKVLSVNPELTPSFNRAEISIKHQRNAPIIATPKLFIKTEKGNKWVETVPYCKGITCYNLIDYKTHEYTFFVEHFSDYYINESGGDYTTVEACFKAINNSADSCIINTNNHHEVFTAKNDFISTQNNGYTLYFPVGNNISLDFTSSTLRHTGNNYWFRMAGNSNNITLRNFSCIMSGNNYACVYSYGSGPKNIFIDNANISGQLRSLTSGISTNFMISNSYIYSPIYAYFPQNSTSWNNIFYADYELFGNRGYHNIYNNSFYSADLIKGGLGDSGLYATGSIYNNLFFNSSVNLPITENILIYNNNFTSLANKTAINTTQGNTSIYNNTFTDVGGYLQDQYYMASYYPLNVSGEIFNDAVMFLDAAGTIAQLITADNLRMQEWTNGSLDFSRAWAFEDTNNIVGIGAGKNLTIYLQEGYAFSCAQISAGFGGTCHYALENRAIVSNGFGNNYTWNDTMIDTNRNYDVTYPPYLNFMNQTINPHPTIFLDVNTESNIFNNVFDSHKVVPVASNGTANVWHNHFYNSVPLINDPNYCVGSIGNYYQEDLSPDSSDCGLTDILTTYFMNECETNYLEWSAQSSLFPINYSIQHSGDGGQNYTIFADTNLTYYNVSGVTMTGNDTFKIVPFDGNYNATNSIKQINMSNVTNLYPRSFTWIRPEISFICGV